MRHGDSGNSCGRGRNERIDTQRSTSLRYAFSALRTARFVLFLPSSGHRRSRDFLCEGRTFFLTKNLMTFFSHHPLLHGHIRHILPPTTFLSHLRGCTSPNSAPFCFIPTKCLEKFFRHPEGAPPGYAYGSGLAVDLGARKPEAMVFLQLSLAIPSWVGAMSTTQRAVMPCDWGVKGVGGR